jgi:hypothetical protein
MEKKQCPYFCAFFQGGDYIINVKVANAQDLEYGYIQNIWIKYKEKHEWEIMLAHPRHWIACSSEDQKFVEEYKINENNQTKYVICLDDVDIVAETKERALNLEFKKDFFKNNPNVKEYFGAVISEERLRYIDALKEVLI